MRPFRPERGNDRPRRRILLDTNVWRYILDHGDYRELHRLSRGKAEIQVAPSVLYEVLRDRDAELRRKLATLLTFGKWQRLMAEAFDECRELRAELRNRRPEWFRSSPKKSVYRRFRADWMSDAPDGFWNRARTRPDAEHRAITGSGNETLFRARQLAQEGRELMDAQGPTFDGASLVGVTASAYVPIAGWNGTPVDAWRFSAAESTWRAVHETGNPYIDWLAPWIDTSKIDRESLNAFFLHEAETAALPRFWVRWAFESLQSLRKVTAGTPCDAQLGTYLLSCDLVVSADKAFVAIANKCREANLFDLGEARLVKGGGTAVDQLSEMIEGFSK